MSSFENVVSGKLKLKGKALDVKSAGLKKKKKHKKHVEESSLDQIEFSTDGAAASEHDEEQQDENPKDNGKDSVRSIDDLLTPAERRYIVQRERIDAQKLAKTANKSHRDRIQDFNQYLANLSEHYDIPKVGPG